MKLPKEEILRIFRETDALLDGHFLLTSGLHSPQYFQCAKVLQYPKYLHLLSGEIAKHFEYSEIELVVSPELESGTAPSEGTVISTSPRNRQWCPWPDSNRHKPDS